MVDAIDTKNTKSSRETRFLLLLISQIGFMVIEPFLFDSTGLTILIDIFLCILLFSCVYAVSETKKTTWIAILLAVPKFTSTWAYAFINHPNIVLFDSIFGSIFIGYIIVLILGYIFRQDEVSLETIYGAIVVFILIGILWLNLYSFTEFVHPGSFSYWADLAIEQRKALVYFSFVTLTTLGYGDITPVSEPAKSLAMLEAIVGQMYIAVLIAKLVGTYISQISHRKRSIERS